MMIIYITLYCIILLLTKNIKISQKSNSFFENHYKRFSLINIFFIFLILTVFMGFREGIGKDYYSYRDIFIWANCNYDKYEGLENGYWLLNKGIGLVTNNPRIMFIVVALLINGTFLFAIQRNCSDFELAIMFYLGAGYYFYAMNIQRQYIAIGIIFASYKFLKQKKIMKFFMIIFLASLFHKSVLVMIILYFVLQGIDNRVFFILTPLLFALINRCQPIFIKILTISSYAHFFNDNDGFIKVRISWWNVFLSLFFFIICIIIHFIYKKDIMLEMKMIYINFWGYIFLSFLGDSITRVLLYLQISYFVVISMVPDLFEPISKKIVKKIIEIAILFLMMIIINVNNFVPYNWGF